MAYLRLFDYSRAIQDVQLSQVITSSDSVRQIGELEAQAECISYLTQKYDTDKEFTDTTIWDNAITYNAGQLVEINYAEYVPATSYVTGNKVVYSGSGYICTASTTGAFDPTKWTVLGLKNDLYYASYPKAEFNYKAFYNVGDEVFYKNKTYTCIIATQVITQQDAIQYGTTR